MEAETIYKLAHKIELSPNSNEEQYFRKAAGVSRFVWNWGLDNWCKQYSTGKKPSGYSLKKEFNASKKTSYPWTYEVTKYASQQPFIHLQHAFNKFFRKESGYPKFKCKGQNDSFYIGNDHFKLDGKRIQIPKLGWVRMREELRFQGRVVSATISCEAGRWFVSLQVEVTKATPVCKSQANIGVDLGIQTLATLSDGTQVYGPKPLKKLLKQLKRLQRQLSRKVKGSRNRDKARMKLAKLHYRIKCIRRDALHKLTTKLTYNYRTIVIEDLNVKGMMQNHCLARAISDMGWYEFRRQLTYKAELTGSNIVIVNRWFASSKTCSNCGSVKSTLPLSIRQFVCGQCELTIDRDVNAAINLLNTVSSTGFQACGEASSGSASIS